MFKKFNLYVFELTKRNWGFPYHIILAFVGTQVAMRFGVHWFICLVTINLIGFIYERIQNKGDAVEDIIGNNIGFLLGLL